MNIANRILERFGIEIAGIFFLKGIVNKDDFA